MIALYNHDCEKSVIGAMLSFDTQVQKLLPTLHEDLMHDTKHAAILEAMKELFQRKDSVDTVTVVNELTRRGTLELSGGAPYLFECSRACPTTVRTGEYIAELRRWMETRNAFKLARGFLDNLTTEGNDFSGSVDELRTALRDLVTPKDRVVRMAELANIIHEDLEKRSNGENKMLMTGIPELDNNVGGIEDTDFMVIGARPGIGKSVLGMQIALNVARKGGKVLICSREMSAQQYGHRMVANLAEINGQMLRRGRIEADAWGDINDACNEMSGYAISFAFQCSTVEELRVMVQHEMDTVGLDLVVVDYLQIMQTSAKKQKRYEEVGAISRGLKMMALDLRIPVIAMAQVGRPQDDKGKAVMPGLSSLRESGNIEQDADIVLFMHHPEKENDESIPDLDKASYGTTPMWKSIDSIPGHWYEVFSLAKVRQGSCTKFGVDFDRVHGRIVGIAR